ncbi:MaoC/PaaZ C-terminal domain-containing protein [Rhodococcus sp. X156]|uniref:MaoC/PaaZ C-terminal domain-containing protein n=1 Tax=Rhodococcus sp. X156 TaxID=2499145 RepID=UPI000FD8AFE4|nr:MaoC/PaaZ C-terminal domain-containing protein [Rhodococcus sp. X156]
MPIDLSVALGAELPEQTFSWTASDVQLYQLGVGAGAHSLDPQELAYVLEDRLQVLPTFATVAASFHAIEAPKVSFPGVEIDLAKVVHGHQKVTVHRPIPTAGTATTRTRIAEVWDKGKAAVIIQEGETVDADGNPLWTTRSGIFARGEGGFGGERGPSDKVELPDRAPDHVVESPILPQQALLYRLCGDRNPLHSDPEFAKAAGFDKPILHGLCSYGVAGKAVVDAVLGGDTSKVASFGVRFAGVLFPGETLRTRIWENDGQYLVTASVVERDDAPVLADGVLTTA